MTHTDPSGTTTSQLHGLVGIQNNQIEIQDPQPGGQAARISADSSVLVYVSEEPVSQPTEVLSRTHIRITLPLKSPPVYDYELEISPNGLRAYLCFQLKTPGMVYSLSDAAPASHITIRTQDTPAPLSDFPEVRENLLLSLEREGIRFGLLEESLNTALEKPGRRVCIARGIAPQVQDDQLKLAWEWPLAACDLAWLWHPLVFEPQAFSLKRVGVGEPVATYRAGKSLSPGKNIYNQVLAPEPQTLTPQIVDGCAKLNLAQAGEFVALQAGIPSCQAGGRIAIFPLEERQGDINGLHQAEWRFPGSFRLWGDLSQQARVTAMQHLEVLGQLNQATLQAGEQVILKGQSIKGLILAGGDAAAGLHLSQYVQRLLGLMQEVQNTFSELLSQTASQRLPPDKALILNLLHSQFKEFAPALAQLEEHKSRLSQLHLRKDTVLKLLLKQLKDLKNIPFDRSHWQEWCQSLADLQADLSPTQGNGHACLQYAQGSEVTASGQIYVWGEGCYNSHLKAGDKILIPGQPGYFREGSLSAPNTILVRELGSPNGSRVRVRLGATGQLFAGQIHPGVEVQMGDLPLFHIVDPLPATRIYAHKGQVRTYALRPDEAHLFPI